MYFYCIVLFLLVFNSENIYTEVDAHINEDVELPIKTDQFYPIIPPIFILNLERAEERWLHTNKLMNDSALVVNRLPAIDGRKLTLNELKNVSTKIAVYLQPRGVIGCYLSHRKFWKLVVDFNLSSAIVFEDDVLLVDNFKDKLINNLEQLNKDGEDVNLDVLFIGAIGRVHPQGKTKSFS
jgi:hypothetical protein